MAQESFLETTLPSHWKEWVAENRILGISDEKITEKLIENGFSQELAQAELADPTAQAYLKVMRVNQDKLNKYEAIMDLLNLLGAQSAEFNRVPLAHRPSRQEFLERFYSKNRPVVLTGLMEDWPARKLWTPEYFKTHYGDEMIEIQVNRNSDPIYEENSDRLKKQILFREYIDMVSEGGETNDYYMTANNHVIENPRMQKLLNDLVMFPEYLRPDHRPSEVFFWYGPAGTITPLHHDRQNIVMAQVTGRKLIKLIPPTQTPLVYNHRTVFSQVDVENPDYDRFPLFRDATVLTGVLGPGQVLFLPNGWWHFVRALDFSITVTFTNFVYPNPIFSW